MNTSKTIKKSSSIVSYVFHPLLMPTFGCFLIFRSGYYLEYLPPKVMEAVFIVILVMTFVLPAIILPALYFQKYIGSLKAEDRNDRILPLSIVGILYGLGYYFMHRNNFPVLIQHFMIGCIASIVVSLLITLRWKISLHTTGIGGLLGLLLFIGYSYQLNLHLLLIITIFIAGLIGCARLIDENHTDAQVYAGYLSGMLTISLSMIIQ